MTDRSIALAVNNLMNGEPGISETDQRGGVQNIPPPLHPAEQLFIIGIVVSDLVFG